MEFIFTYGYELLTAVIAILTIAVAIASYHGKGKVVKYLGFAIKGAAWLAGLIKRNKGKAQQAKPAKVDVDK